MNNRTMKKGIKLPLAVVAAVLWTATATADVIIFREGLDSYTGSSVARILPSPGSTSLDEATFTLKNSTKARALLRFDDLFGSDPGQIALDMDLTITSATITMRRSTGASPRGTSLFRNLTSYDPTTVTYANYSSPATNPVAGTNYQTIADDGFSTNTNTTYDFDVTATLQAWLATPSTNLGWYVSNTSGSNDVTWHGITATTEAWRPTLSITVIPEPSTFLMVGLGLGALVIFRRRR